MSHFRNLSIVVVVLIVITIKENSGQLKTNNSVSYTSKKISPLKETPRSAIKDYSFGESSIPVSVHSSFTESSPYEGASSSNNNNYQYHYYPYQQYQRKKWCPYGSNLGRCLTRQDYGNTGTDSDDDFDLSSLGGLAGLAGLLGLTGLKGLGPLALLKLPFLLPVLLPVLAPLLLPLLLPVLFLAALILFFPIPVITIPTGRSSTQQNSYVTVLHLASALAGEECVERISCEIVSRGTGFKIVDWIKKVAEENAANENKWLKKVYKGIKTNSNGSENENACQKLTCSPKYL